MHRVSVIMAADVVIVLLVACGNESAGRQQEEGPSVTPSSAQTPGPTPRLTDRRRHCRRIAVEQAKAALAGRLGVDQIGLLLT